MLLLHYFDTQFPSVCRFACKFVLRVKINSLRRNLDQFAQSPQVPELLAANTQTNLRQGSTSQIEPISKH